MAGTWIRKITGVMWPVALMRILLWLALCLLIGALLPAAVAALGNDGPSRHVDVTTAATSVGHAPTYRYAGQPDGTTAVQPSRDRGLTWTMPALATLMGLAILAAMVTPIWRAPRRHFGTSDAHFGWQLSPEREVAAQRLRIRLTTGLCVLIAVSALLRSS
jgi:hypothetical protein